MEVLDVVLPKLLEERVLGPTPSIMFGRELSCGDWGLLLGRKDGDRSAGAGTEGDNDEEDVDDEEVDEEEEDEEKQSSMMSRPSKSISFM